jgi:hypothetical protein
MFFRVSAECGDPPTFLHITHLPEESTRMSASASAKESFVERRSPAQPSGDPIFERRQFANNYDELSPEAAELARAIDGYKVQHRRRFITFEEMVAVIKSLGYTR